MSGVTVIKGAEVTGSSLGLEEREPHPLDHEDYFSLEARTRDGRGLRSHNQEFRHKQIQSRGDFLNLKSQEINL